MISRISFVILDQPYKLFVATGNDMKKRHIIKYAVLGIILLLLFSLLSLLIWSETGTYPAGATALSALESTESVTVRQDKFIVFEPDKKTKIGLIFYPGGLVEPSAYAPVLHQIAEEGVLVVIAPMPFNLAIFCKRPNHAKGKLSCRCTAKISSPD